MGSFDPRSAAATGAAGFSVLSLTTLLSGLVPFDPLLIALVLSFVVAFATFTPANGATPQWKRGLLYTLAALSVWASAAGQNGFARKGEEAVRVAQLAAPAFAMDAEPEPTPRTAYRCYTASNVEVACDSPEQVRAEPLRLKRGPALPESQRLIRQW